MLKVLRNCFLILDKRVVFFAFFISSVVSILAILDRAVIPKDGAFYVYIARHVSEHGFKAAFGLFNWPWYSMLIAAINNASGLPHDIVAYALSVLFMSGVCALVVSMVVKAHPAARWWAVLLVLSVPVYNEFRGEVIRESGFWFFVTLSAWLVSVKGVDSWKVGCLFQFSVILACFFRLEAFFLVFAVGFCFVFMDRELRFRERLVRVLRFNSIFLFFSFSVVLYLALFDAQLGTRVARYLKLLNPIIFVGSIELISEQFADVALQRWSHSDSTVIVVSGMLFALVWRVVCYAGVSSVLLLFKEGRSELLKACSSFKFNFSAIAVYFFVLFVFFVQAKFVNSRYTAVLLLIAVPLLSVAVFEFSKKHNKLGRLIMYVSMVFVLANVVSFSDKKTHYIPVAEWIKSHTAEGDRILYDDPRIAYYAGRPWPDSSMSFQEVVDQGRQDEYDYLMVELGKNSIESEGVMAGFEILEDFSNRKRTIYILAQRPASRLKNN